VSEFKYLDIDCAAWVRDTHHLRPLARGIYMDLLMLAWSMPKNRIPNDPKRLRELLHYLPAEMSALDEVVRLFWMRQSGGKYLIQKRLNKEYRSALSRKLRGKNAANTRWGKGKMASGNASTDTVTVTVTGGAPQTPRGGLTTTRKNSGGKRRKRNGIEEAFAELEQAERRAAQRSQNGSTENPGCLSELQSEQGLRSADDRHPGNLSTRRH
jgi:uncharacterized protein YdaU (DUF1376 family)